MEKLPKVKNRIYRSHWIKLVLLLMLLFGAYGILGNVEVEEIFTPERLIHYLETLGPSAPFIFIGIMAAAVVVSPIPSLPLDLAAGVVFGPFMGMVYAVAGAEIGAILSFLLGRALGREVIFRLFRIEVTFCEKCSDHQLMGMVFLARLLPVFSFDLVSYGAGLTNMSLRAFALTTLVGMIPPTFALTYFGGSVVAVHWPLVLSALILIGFFLVLPRLLLKNRSAWWVRLMGVHPLAPGGEFPKAEPSVKVDHDTCPMCGEPR